MRPASLPSRSASRGDAAEFVDLASRKAPRGLSRFADSALVQADVARMEARLGSARAYLVETLTTIYAEAGESHRSSSPSARGCGSPAATRSMVRSRSRTSTYKAAGVDAIFPGSPFERRFRDMHTLSQQIQSRAAHFEAVGHILLGGVPDVFF